MRRAFAHEIRQIQQASAANRYLGDILIDEVIRIDAKECGLVLVDFGEIVTEPAQ